MVNNPIAAVYNRIGEKAMKRVLCVCLVFAMCLCLCSCKSSDYKDAMALLEAGEYEMAKAAFEALGDYEDSIAKSTECEMEMKYLDAVALMDAGQYEEAIAVFETLAEHKGSTSKIEECETAILEITYDHAIAALDAGDVIQAYESLKALDGYKDSAERAAVNYTEYEVAKLQQASVGDYVIFGKYEQDANISNGKEAVEWLVASKDDTKIFLLSKYALECMPYHTSHEKVVWKNCSLRQWLNNDFMDAAFSAEEKSIIQTTLHITSENNELTEDHVFLPTPYFTKKYAGNEGVIQCKPTAYAAARGACDSWWLLDDPINLNLLKDSFAKIAIDEVGVSGSYHLALNKNGVRPAMYISIKP